MCRSNSSQLCANFYWIFIKTQTNSNRCASGVALKINLLNSAKLPQWLSPWTALPVEGDSHSKCASTLPQRLRHHLTSDSRAMFSLITVTAQTNWFLRMAWTGNSEFGSCLSNGPAAFPAANEVKYSGIWIRNRAVYLDTWIWIQSARLGSLMRQGEKPADRIN